jgi:hypothetical protein
MKQNRMRFPTEQYWITIFLSIWNNEPKDTLLSNVDYVKLDAAVANALMSMEKKIKEHGLY